MRVRKKSDKTSDKSIPPIAKAQVVDSIESDGEASSSSSPDFDDPAFDQFLASGLGGSFDGDDDDDETNLIMVEEADDFSEDASSQPTPGSASASTSGSLYLSEKTSKKQGRGGKATGKDGSGQRKAKRKDKGQSRVTAYMLWGKDMRKEIQTHNPNIDFSNLNKKLGELWATVPSAKKYNYRRKAQRQRAQAKGEIGSGQAVKMKSTGKTPVVKTPVKSVSDSERSTAARTLLSSEKATAFQNTSRSQMRSPTLADIPLYKVVGTAPIDVAAHLTLLGESLSIIGQRLTEHEGQIAVSGSYSVLLDSILCALGPLLCLTQLVPETNGCDAQTLSETLDNIAYIMPGL